jgi:hypothetical protein
MDLIDLQRRIDAHHHRTNFANCKFLDERGTNVVRVCVLEFAASHEGCGSSTTRGDLNRGPRAMENYFGVRSWRA